MALALTAAFSLLLLTVPDLLSDPQPGRRTKIAIAPRPTKAKGLNQLSVFEGPFINPPMKFSDLFPHKSTNYSARPRNLKLDQFSNIGGLPPHIPFTLKAIFWSQEFQ
jgi:hypothetical protein